MDVQGVVGPRNAEHFAAYTRLDLRANRDVQLRNSKLSFYLEVTNLLNSKNECCINDYHLEPGRSNSVVPRNRDRLLAADAAVVRLPVGVLAT